MVKDEASVVLQIQVIDMMYARRVSILNLELAERPMTNNCEQKGDLLNLAREIYDPNHDLCFPAARGSFSTSISNCSPVRYDENQEGTCCLEVSNV